MLFFQKKKWLIQYMGFEKKSFYMTLDGTLLISLTSTLIKLQNKQQNFIHITRNKSF